jgi:hypothetical protein
MTVASRFTDEIKAAPKFAAAAQRDPQWLDELDALAATLQAVYGSDAAGAIAASDRITAIIHGAAPLKARLLAVNDVLADLTRGVN